MDDAILKSVETGAVDPLVNVRLYIGLKRGQRVSGGGNTGRGWRGGGGEKRRREKEGEHHPYFLTLVHVLILSLSFFV